MMVGTQRVDGGSVVNSPKSYGITKPLSLAGPSPADFKRNLELEKVNNNNNNKLITLCYVF